MPKLIEFMFEHRERAAVLFAKYIAVFIGVVFLIGMLAFFLGYFGYWK